MSTARVSSDEIRNRALARRDDFGRNGICISDWARERGFSVKLVHNVLGGTRACNFGESHRIAVALGIKPDPAAPAAKFSNADPSNMAIAA